LLIIFGEILARMEIWVYWHRISVYDVIGPRAAARLARPWLYVPRPPCWKKQSCFSPSNKDVKGIINSYRSADTIYLKETEPIIFLQETPNHVRLRRSLTVFHGKYGDFQRSIPCRLSVNASTNVKQRFIKKWKWENLSLTHSYNFVSWTVHSLIMRKTTNKMHWLFLWLIY
jgi:hypothetical protein